MSLKDRNRFRRQRERMFKEHPFCHWCGRKLRLVEMCGGLLPDDAATIDHLYSRLHPERTATPKPNAVRRVLACRRCNHERGQKEDAALPILVVGTGTLSFYIEVWNEPRFKGKREE